MTIIVPHCPACGHLVEQCRCAELRRMQTEDERRLAESGYYERVRKVKDARNNRN